MIDHANGYTSFYRHLLKRPALEIGQAVSQGEIVAKTGDPDETCNWRPHRHLEIHNAGTYNRAFNPVPLIDTDWESLSLIGPFNTGFARDLSIPRQWQNLYNHRYSSGDRF